LLLLLKLRTLGKGSLAMAILAGLGLLACKAGEADDGLERARESRGGAAAAGANRRLEAPLRSSARR
jgi:hypothetical protein